MSNESSFAFRYFPTGLAPMARGSLHYGRHSSERSNNSAKTREPSAQGGCRFNEVVYEHYCKGRYNPPRTEFTEVEHGDGGLLGGAEGGSGADCVVCSVVGFD